MKVQDVSWIKPELLISIFFITFLQAFLSLLLSLALAVFAVRGLFAYSGKPWYFILEWLYLLPFLLPFIAVAGGLMNSLEALRLPLFGLFPLVLSQGFIYGGAMAVVLARLMSSRCRSLCDWAVVHGVGRWRLIKALLQFALRREVQMLSLAVFCFCFTSFSLPLLLGGAKYKTIEVFIYDYLKDLDTWPQALGLLLFEILFIFIILIFCINKNPLPPQTKKSLSYLSFKPFVLAGLLPLFLIFIGLFQGLFYLPEVMGLEAFLPALKATLITATAVSLGVIFFLILISLSEAPYLHTFLVGWGAPSVVLTGFSFLIFFEDRVYVSWIAGLLILILPALYRLMAESLFKSLKGPVQTAKTFGAGPWLIFKHITWPLSRRPIFLLAGIGGFWASGDFALTMMTSQGELNLGILAQQFLGQYRLEQGLAVIWILLITGSLCLAFFSGLSILWRRKGEKLCR